MNQAELRREETRGIFALGVIATVIAFRQEFAATSSLAASLVFLIAAQWGLYVFLMTVGVSDDVFKPTVIEACLIYAKLAFWAGVAGVGVVIALSVGGLFLGGVARGLTLCDPSGIVCFHGLFGILALPIVAAVYIWFFRAAHIWREAWSWMTSDIRNWWVRKRADVVPQIAVGKVAGPRRARTPGRRTSTRTRKNNNAPRLS